MGLFYYIRLYAMLKNNPIVAVIIITLIVVIVFMSQDKHPKQMYKGDRTPIYIRR